MPLHVRSAAHGHQAYFPSASSTLSPHISTIVWGPSSISLPSASPLNLPADVWLRLPAVSLPRARRWCARHRAVFLGLWHSPLPDSRPAGFGFRVQGFSRYRYVESDEDEHDHDDQQLDTHHPATASARRRARTQAAGRTPIRPSAPRPKPVPHRPTPRKRMAVDDSDEDDDLDEQPQPLAEPADIPADDSDASAPVLDPFTPAAWHLPAPRPALLAPVDAAPDASLRAALFDEPLPFAKGPALAGPQREDEDVAMEDVAGVDDVDDDEYNVFDRDARKLREADADAHPEAGDFVLDGELRTRRPPADVFFPPTSLPFPTMEDSVAAGKEGVTSDTGLMLGRSTRVCFSHTGMLVWPCYGVSERDAFATPGFVTDVANLYAGCAAVPRESLSKMLRVHCSAWYGALPTDGQSADREAGVRAPTLKDSFLHPQVADAVIDQFIEDLKCCHEEGGDVNAQHAQVALWLLLALYKKENEPAFGGGDTLLKRVAVWAKGPAGTAFDRESNCRATGLRSALISLSLGNIEEGVSAATKAGHLRLALLIARALESPKDDLRADAEAQLAAYGLSPEREEGDEEGPAKWDWDDMLSQCRDDAAVSVDERMILLILAGHVAPVARYLGLSWYRLFIMEFFHGAGSSDLTQAERVSAAVQAIADTDIVTLAPHGSTQDEDVAYHLLRLYADPTASYSLTSGVYANASFGSVYSPLDARFSWLTYQILTAVIPQASTPNAPQVLADEFSSQLRAVGLHLWSYYVLCSGNVPDHVTKNALIRDWPNMVNDFIEWTPSHGLDSQKSDQKADGEGKVSGRKVEDLSGRLGAELFLEEVLGVPRAWIAEAKAVVAHVDGEHLEECNYWIASGTEDGVSRAHEILAKQVFPDMIACQDSSRYGDVVEVLRQLEASKHVADWSIYGGLILNYLEYVVGVPNVKRQPLAVYRGMVNRVRSWAARARTPEQHHMAAAIADGIATAERAQLFRVKAVDRRSILEQVVEDLERLPCSRGVKLRVAGEYKVEAEHGHAVALRFSAAYPRYAHFVDPQKAEVDAGVAN